MSRAMDPDASGDPKMRQRQPPASPPAIGDLLGGLMRGRGGLARQHRVHAKWREAWIAAAGEQLADHTRVRSFRNGILTIEVDDAPLLHELGAFRKESLLSGMLERVSDHRLRDLRSRLGVFESDHG